MASQGKARPSMAKRRQTRQKTRRKTRPAVGGVRRVAGPHEKRDPRLFHVLYLLANGNAISQHTPRKNQDIQLQQTQIQQQSTGSQNYYLTSSFCIPAAEPRSTPCSKLEPFANTAACEAAAAPGAAGAPTPCCGTTPTPRDVDCCCWAAASSGFMAGKSKTSLMLF